MVNFKATLVMGFFVIVISGLAIQQAGIAPKIAVDKFGSGTAPMAVAICLIILAIIVVVEDYVADRKIRDDRSPDEAEHSRLDTHTSFWQSNRFKGVGSIGAFFIYVMILEQTSVSFWLLTSCFLLLASRIVEGDLRRWLIISILLSLGLGLALEMIFTRFLLIELP